MMLKSDKLPDFVFIPLDIDPLLHINGIDFIIIFKYVTVVLINHRLYT